ncbi:MAG: MASE3 domain-containing protein [Calditrichia bacterium]
MKKVHLIYIPVSLFIFVALYWLSRSNYLLFHSLSELFSIVIGMSIALILWNMRQQVQDRYLYFLAGAYLFISILDLLHLLSYKGMGVLPDQDGNIPTQLWIAARFTESVSLLVAPFLVNRSVKVKNIIWLLSAWSVLLIFSILVWNVFPDCYRPGLGLTPFKIGMEFVIIGILGVSIYVLFQRREEFHKRIFRLLVAAFSFTILSEVSFSIYTDVYGFLNFVGHFLKIVSFYLIYKAIVESGLREPFNLLYRHLQIRETELVKERDLLSKTLRENKVLRRFLPICANCKRIRDENDEWHTIERYFREHSDVQFSHGICPQCSYELYPEIREKLSGDRDNEDD